MNWTQLLKMEAEGAYAATTGLMKMVDADALGWKPETGDNWMTTGQLLMHITTACGHCVRGFVTGDWGMPEGKAMEDMSPEEMMPPSEKMPAVETVDQALELLEKDKALAMEMIDQAGEEDLKGKMLGAPWAPGFQMALGQHILHMVDHLSSHKGQLFYYLKLRGKPVHTGTLWGM